MGEFYAHAERAADSVGAVAILYDLGGKSVLNTRRPLGIEVPGRDPSNLPAPWSPISCMRLPCGATIS